MQHTGAICTTQIRTLLYLLSHIRYYYYFYFPGNCKIFQRKPLIFDLHRIEGELERPKNTDI